MTSYSNKILLKLIFLMHMCSLGPLTKCPPVHVATEWKPFDYHFKFLDSDRSIQAFTITLDQPWEVIGIQELINLI